MNIFSMRNLPDRASAFYRRLNTAKKAKQLLDLSFLVKADWGLGCFVEDYFFLAGIIANLKPVKILEIGTSTGLGAVLMAHVASNFSHNVKVTSIDISQSQSRENLHLVTNVEESIEFLEGNSSELLVKLKNDGRSFDMVFIDGSHTYEQAKKDWTNVQSLTSTYIFHDTTQFSGLQRLISEIRNTHEYDVFQMASKPGHRISPHFRRECFCTGITLVQDLNQLDGLSEWAHRDEYGGFLPGHSDTSHPMTD